MSSTRVVLCVASALAVVSLPLAAQVTMPDSAERARLMANADRMSHPAEYILGFRTELSLSPDQVGLLENVAKSQRDSIPARMQRMMDVMRSTAKDHPATSFMAWSGPIDEKVIREQACAQSAAQVESMLNIVRDRHVVGEILTEAQRAMLPMVEAQAMMKIMQKP